MSNFKKLNLPECPQGFFEFPDSLRGSLNFSIWSDLQAPVLPETLLAFPAENPRHPFPAGGRLPGLNQADSAGWIFYRFQKNTGSIALA
jgi:hypothetical protein